MNGLKKLMVPSCKASRLHSRSSIQIILFHVQEYVQLRWDAFFTGLEEDSKAEEDAIWTRLDKIRRVIRPDDFETHGRSCLHSVRMEVDASLWNVFVHGDETIRRNVANAAGQERYEIAGALSKEHFAKIHSGEEEFAPPDVRERMEQRSSVGRRSRAGYSTKWIIGHRSFNLMSRRIKESDRNVEELTSGDTFFSARNAMK